MPIESATYISQLAESNPASADPAAQGDDHIRLIKQVLKNTFPNLSAAVTANASTLNALAGLTATPTELDYMAGVTSPVQTQLDTLTSKDTSLDGDIAGLDGRVSTLESSTAIPPTGAIMPFAGSSAPAGWLLCQGQAISRTTYATLFAVIGTTYGVGDGSTTFNLPDLTNEFIRGVGSYSLGQKFSDEIKAHTHGPGSLSGTTNSAGSHNHTSQTAFGAGVQNDETGIQTTTNDNAGTLATSTTGAHTHTVTINGGVTGSTGGSETRPRGIALNFIIKT